MATARVNLKNVQGDLIDGLQKRVEAFLFIVLKSDLTSISDFRQHLKSNIFPLITSAQDVIDNQRKIDDSKKNKKPGDPKISLPITETNIGFSATGLLKMGLNSDELPTGVFATGQKTDAINNLGDPIDPSTKKLSTWSSDFLSHSIDLVILITAPDQTLLDQKINQVKGFLKNSISSSFILQGNVRPGSQAGHEHFGFLDGVSNPKLQDINSHSNDQKAGIVKPGVILLGQVDDQGNNPLTPKEQWMKDGSIMAFRQLKQLVPEFDSFCAQAAQSAKSLTSDLIGARIVGRWKSGTPIELAPTQDNSNLIGAQNFDYSDDLSQAKCPYAAHIRKTNPRNGLSGADPTTAVLPHLMVRNGIPYGPELTASEQKSKKTIENRGLLFVSYQSQLENGFQFVQQLWCNNINFPPKSTVKVTPGFDLLIGQTSNQAPRVASNIIPKGTAGDSDPNNTLTALQQFIVPLGGEYFFMPSLEAIKTKLTL
ncbi:hypothetical protein O181_031734 [Austropuccinia psidii MF-1]|uniref:Dyp-type peroxidase n=1 Tax=Austropuccinia psidii MF-1 TaxID=1389203 RepID=A0A9Q3CW94_9BASI|nr:hypothetical protein [Austropuccinia psidii MF-1]